jgi:GTPase
LATHANEKAILVGIGLKTEPLSEIKESLAELEELTYAAGATVVSALVQVLPKFVPATLMGTGKVTEIAALAQELDASLVVVDHQLSGGQLRNLEAELKVKVLDRSQLILDIFAQRAQTYEGKLQVELAQALDQLPRMVGGWLGSLSRLGGGIGTRGPGETALEMDRRRIKDRVEIIKRKLEVVRKNRAQYRSQRKKLKVPSFALIGYTNSGKSSLLNRLTQSNVLAKDQLFATLDPTTRKVYLPEIQNAVMTDTVGFIRKLPPHLIEAFKATLEESAEADILMHVIDLSSEQMDQQIDIVDQLIAEFSWNTKPMIYVFNKMDKASVEKQMKVKAFPRVFVSALTGAGVDRLKEVMVETVKSQIARKELYFAKRDEFKIYDLSRDAQIVRQESTPSGTLVEVFLTETLISKWSEYVVK